MTCKVLIVDDHPIVRRGLKVLIADEHDMEVCGEAGDMDSALKVAETTRPDVIVVDLTLKQGHGLELIQLIRQRDRRVKMVVSSMHEDALYAERAVRCGASGYVNKDEPPEKIIEAIRAVLRGRIYVTFQVAERLLQRLHRGQAPEENPLQSLTDRELEVFELIGQGLSVKQIAQKLAISQKTVAAHRDSIKTKLQLGNSHEVNRRATLWVAQGR
jgi:DNA-binding NarL/FixJ family response regulator